MVPVWVADVVLWFVFGIQHISPAGRRTGR